MHVTYRESLSINCANCNAPIVGIDSRQLWNVRCNFAVVVALALPVDLFDVLGEVEKVGNDKLMAKSACNEDDVRFDDAVGKLKVLKILYDQSFIQLTL